MSQELADKCVVRCKQENADGADRRRQRIDTGIRCQRVKSPDPIRAQQQPEHTKYLPCDRGRAACGGSIGPCLECGESDECTHQYFPTTRRQEKECERGIGRRPIVSGGQAQDCEQNQGRDDPSLAEPPSDEQKDRIEHVILFFNGQTPGMQQGVSSAAGSK